MILTTFNVVRPSAPETNLTEREREILSLLAKGLIKKEIADELGVSYHTVDTHVRNIYGKLKVHNLSGAVAKAIQLGLT
jgi:DNA-binding CsgD family transcriptional regulator